MSIYFYDKAIVERVRTVIKDKDVHIISNEKMFTKSRDANDNPSLPAVSLYREGFSLSTLNRNISMYREGRFNYDELGNPYFTRSLPISIVYQIDVWTRTREQNDEFVRDLLWYFTLFPQHKIQLSYEDFKREVGFNVFIGDRVIDNSDINEFENRGQYYRSTFELNVDEAQIFMIQKVDYTKIKLDIKAYDLKGVEFDSETIFDNT